MKKSSLLLAALFAASAASADFEGVLHMKITAGPGSGTMKASVSKAGVRNEMNIQTPHMPMKFTTLILFKNQNVVYQIDDQNKTYSEIDVSKARETAQRRDDESYTVKKLGEETLQGYRCQHVLVSGKRSGDTELWTTRELLDYASFSKARPRDQESPAFLKALQDAGADGFPVKSIHRAGKEEAIMELVKVEKKSLPAALFQIPDGYAKQESFRPTGAPPMPPDAMKAMKEQMMNMSPEQREMMEKMMKGRSGQ